MLSFGLTDMFGATFLNLESAALNVNGLENMKTSM